jgi:hypothetical protein
MMIMSDLRAVTLHAVRARACLKSVFGAEVHV